MAFLQIGCELRAHIHGAIVCAYCLLRLRAEDRQVFVCEGFAGAGLRPGFEGRAWGRKCIGRAQLDALSGAAIGASWLR